MRNFFFFMLFTVAYRSIGQDNFMVKSDSLIQLLNQSTQDLESAKLLAKLQDIWQPKNLAKSIEYGKEALTFAKKSGDQNEIMATMSILAFAYMNIGDAPKSIDILQQLLPLTENKNPDGHSMALAFIAMNYKKQGDYGNALEYAQRAFQVSEKADKEKKTKDPRGYFGGPMNLAEIFEKRNELDSALYYGQMCYQRILNKKLPDGSEFFAWQNRWIFGKIQQRLHDDDVALKLYREALIYAVKIDDNIGIQSVQLSMATLFEKLGRLDSAIIYARHAFEGGQATVNHQVVSEAGFLLKKIYQKQGDSAKALYYSDQATLAKDSLITIEKTRVIQNLTFKEERRQQELEAERIAYQNQIRQNAMLAGLAFFLTIALILYRNNAQKQRLNEQLQRQKEEIRTLNSDLENKIEQRTLELQNALNEVSEAFNKGQTAERKRVSADLHDEIGSALSTIAIFSDLTKRKAQKTAPELVNELERIGIKSRDMIQTMRDTIWTLNEDNPQSLWERMYQYGSETLAAKNITLHWQIPMNGESVNVPFAAKRNLFMAYKEVLNNVVKHAEATAVSVKWKGEGGDLAFSISDNGKGFDVAKAQNQGNGLRNFEERMKAIGGKVTIESNIGKGTTLTFFLNPNL